MKNMSEDAKLKKCEVFYGSVTVGERRQVVVPAEARAELGFEPGDKLLVMKHPLYDGIVMFKIDAVREFLDHFQAGLQAIERKETEDGS